MLFFGCWKDRLGVRNLARSRRPISKRSPTPLWSMKSVGVRRRPETHLGEGVDAGPPSEEPSPSSRPSPERRAEQSQLGASIAACLSSLKPERRQALVLYLEGHSVVEAARLLGWSHKKTENLVYRGLADLRRQLRRKGIEP